MMILLHKSFYFDVLGISQQRHVSLSKTGGILIYFKVDELVVIIHFRDRHETTTQKLLFIPLTILPRYGQPRSRCVEFWRKAQT